MFDKIDQVMAYEGSWANWQNRTAVGYPSSILKQAHLPKQMMGFGK